MSPQLDPTFAAALRTALVEEVRAPRPPRRRARVGACALAGAALVTGGVAVADQFDTRPGADEVRPLSEPITVERTGTATVALGTPPAEADHLELSLVCLTEGHFAFPDGAELQCADPSPGGDERYRTTTHDLALLPGENATTITAGPGERWRLTATYASVRTTEWALNDSGDTYGVENEHGRPDLIAVIATNGREGYSYAREFDDPSPNSPAEALAWQNGPQVTVHVPVYTSDGRTVVGEFLRARSAGAQAVVADREPAGT